MNTDFLIPVQANQVHIGDKFYLGQERFGKLFKCISVNPIVVSENISHTEYTLDAKEYVYLPDPIIQFIHEYINDCEKVPEYDEFAKLMAVFASSDYMQQFSPEAIEEMHIRMRYLYGRLFTRARAAAFK